PVGPPAPVPVDVGVDRIMAELRGETERPRPRGPAPLPGSAPAAIVEPNQGAGSVPDDASSPGGSAGHLVAVDSSALVRRWLPDAHRRLVADTLARADAWCAAELARTEAMLALHRAAGDPFTATALWDRLRADWDAFFVVPVDGRCCARAAELGARFGLATVDAVHLAAADRLPRPVVWLTFDHRQIPAAAALGFEVVSPVA
ncbi:MAG: PIN domain-containing protein, partial [Actinomyces sp.]